MVDAMTNISSQTETDLLVIRARTEADALAQLYELYYDRMFRFCLHRLFDRTIAQDVTSTVFLNVASQISRFNGETEEDFRNWLYAIASNHANEYIRKTLRRKKLLAQAAVTINSVVTNDKGSAKLDWPTVYQAVLKLKPKEQTIVTLRFFENLGFDRIAAITNLKESSVRVTLHRSLKKLRNYLSRF